MSSDIDLVIGAQDKATVVLNRVAGSVSSFAVGALGKVGPAAVAAGTALAGFVASAAALNAVITSVSEASERIDALTHTARGLGESVGDLQAFQFAMDEAGQVSAEGTIAALQKIQRLVGEVATSGKGGEIFAKLGLDAQKLNLQKPIEQFMAIKNAIGSIENVGERAAAATQLLGKSAADLIPALIAGNDEFADSIEAAERLGLVVSEQAAMAIGEMNGELGRLQAAMDGLANQVAAEVAPAFTALLQVINELAPPVILVAQTALPQIVDGLAMSAGIAKDLAKAFYEISTLDFGAAFNTLDDNSGAEFLAAVERSRVASAKAAQEQTAAMEAASQATSEMTEKEVEQQNARRRQVELATAAMQQQVAAIAEVELAILAADQAGDFAAVDQLKDKLSELKDGAAATYATIQSIGDAQEGAANKTIDALNRQLAVATIGEEAVKKQEELAAATNNIEREKIAILQDQIEQQKELKKLAESQKKQSEEDAKIRQKQAEEDQKLAEQLDKQQQKQIEKEQAEQQKKADAIANVQPGVNAVESRILTRGPMEKGVDKLVTVNELTNKLLINIEKKLVPAEPKANGVTLELIA